MPIYPLVPLAANTALGIAVLSYDGAPNFGLNADYDALPDLELLARDLEQAIAETFDRVGDAAAWPPDPQEGRGPRSSRATARRDAPDRRSSRPPRPSVVRPACLQVACAWIVPPVTGRRKLVWFDMPLATCPLAPPPRPSQNEVRLSAIDA